jgi:hypothetical protein
MFTKIKNLNYKSVSTILVAVTLLVGGFFIASSASAIAAPVSTTVYDATPSALPPNVASLGYQATSTKEFGDYVHLAGAPDRLLKTVTVTMSNWALQSTPANQTFCSTNPTKCTAGGFIHPITVNIYKNTLDGNGVPTTLLATKTVDVTVPWRPEADVTCPGGTAWKAGDNNCYNGLAFNAVFDMSSLNVTLSDDVIVGIAYNTQSYGSAPLGVDGPYNSLNVGVPANQPVTTGADANTDNVFWNTSFAGFYTDGGDGGVGTFRTDTNWTPNGTIAMKIEATPASQSTTVVHQGDLAANFGDVLANPSKWLFYNDETDTIDNTQGSMVTGPGTPPLGTGSAQISVTGTQRRNLATYQFSGTKLGDISTLKFSTYNPSAGNGGSVSRSAYLQFNVDFSGNDSWQKRLVFVPSQNGTVTADNWKEWDAIQGGNAKWNYSGATWPTTATGPDANVVGTPGSTLRTWNAILADYPGIKMRTSDSFFGLRVGEPYADGYTENLDKVVVGTGAIVKTFDFEPTPTTAKVTIDKYINGVQASSANTNSTAFPMHAIYPGGEGDYTLSPVGFNNPDPYKATTSDMPAGSAYSTYENASTSCSNDSQYALVGYTTGNTLSEAAGGTPSQTVPSFTNLSSDKFVIVWNKTCVPLPVHLSPADNSVRTTAEQTSIDWSDVTNWFSPISYIYQAANSLTTNPDGSFTSPVYTSTPLSTSEIPTPGTPAGVYYWHVRAIDSASNSSAWTAPWKLTIDNTPVAPTKYKVHIFKYEKNGATTAQVPNESADPSFPMNAKYDIAGVWTNLDPGDGYVLGDGGGAAGSDDGLRYAANTIPLSAGDDYGTSEVTDGSVVVPADSASCPAGKFRLVGYKTGTTKETALVAEPTTTAPFYSDINSDHYVIVVNEKCGEVLGASTLKVHIYKYLDNGDDDIAQVADDSDAPSFPMTAAWSAENIGSGTGDYVLGNHHGGTALKYAADTAAMSAPADYTTSEVVDNSVIVENEAACSTGKYYLVGYRSGADLESAEAAGTQNSAPIFSGITTDKTIIVINKKCADDLPPPNSCTPNDAANYVSDDSDGGTQVDGHDAVAVTPHPAWTTIPGATWIWSDQPTTDENEQLSATVGTKEFTKTFSISGTPLDSTLNIAADNTYTVSVNGHDLDTGTSGTDSDNFTSADTWTIPAEFLQASNTITFTVTNQEKPEGYTGPNPAGLIFKLTVNSETCEPEAPTTGSLKVTKTTVNDDGTFNFTGNDIAAFSISTESNTGSHTIENLTPGSYTITEGTLPDGWEQTSSTCTGVTVVAGSEATCTITNTFTQPEVVQPSINRSGFSSGGGGGFAACADSKDNDNDGLTDANDPGCHSDNNANNGASYVASDTDEQNGQVLGASTEQQPAGQVLGASSFHFTLFLKMGPPYSSAQADEVMELQKFLNGGGYGPLVVDGKFGPLTKAALIKFQLANGLVGDGIVGPLTRAVLNK